MPHMTEDFSLNVDAVTGVCPSGERWAEARIAEKSIPVLSCEGPCIRGDIARLAANIVSRQAPYARACYAETALVPHSAMAAWVRQADEVVMIDGCFLKCIGRVVSHLTDREKIIHIDALPLHKRYAKIFHMEDVPESERKETAQQTAEKILDLLANRKAAIPVDTRPGENCPVSACSTANLAC